MSGRYRREGVAPGVGEAARAPRVVLLHPSRGPITARDWSGTPLGLITGLRELGAEVHEVGYGVNGLVRRTAHLLSMLATSSITAAERSALKMELRRSSFQRQLDRLGPVDAIVAVGTDCYRLDRLRLPAPVATYDDATLAAMWAHPDSDTSRAGFRPEHVRRWIATQRESSRAATVCCVSTAWAGRAFTGDYGVPPERIAVVGMGHRPRRPAVHRERDWSTPTYLFVGIDWERKNGDAVLRAFSRLREDVPQATLHLVGRHSRVDRPGVVDHGLLARDDPQAQRVLDDLLARATVFVLPSRFDPSPIAYLEAASAGMPVIATTAGGAGELLGEAAIAVAPTDEVAILRAMTALAEPAEAARRGALASAAAEEETWRHVAARILGALGSPTEVAAAPVPSRGAGR
ncbi:glycosyltransferase family 4 protein [Microbacterium caowuchunii]|uniref:glycosyltransferase family 4 protein n=1 Tax=Microbacterium caowuchunii TaxID=2614638 RepID=UPI0017851FAD|nr:glycosyltransferase family 4 protein [Microbacterium caowuchunii]